MCAPWGVLVLMGFLKKSQDEGGTPYAPSICEISSGFLVISKQQILMFPSTQLSEFFTISEE